jgi:hypothetical protein
MKKRASRKKLVGEPSKPLGQIIAESVRGEHEAWPTDPAYSTKGHMRRGLALATSKGYFGKSMIVLLTRRPFRNGQRKPFATPWWLWSPVKAVGKRNSATFPRKDRQVEALLTRQKFRN